MRDKSLYMNKTLLMIDNYDSFTYNLVQYFGDLGWRCDVHRNDKTTIDDIKSMAIRGIVISPGPADPDSSGVCLDVVRYAADHSIPLFGVCLGHQCIGQAFGGDVIRAPSPVHGKTSTISHENGGVFSGLANPLTVTRYHSLLVDRKTLPDQLEITAHTMDDNLIMGLSHKNHPIHGVQFHPESIATDEGHQLLKNFTDQL